MTLNRVYMDVTSNNMVIKLWSIACNKDIITGLKIYFSIACIFEATEMATAELPGE